MHIPILRGIIDRRILVNYRVDPRVLARLLPAPFQPKLVAGHAVAGICLIRLRDVRPRFLPAGLGLSSENAAHRFAVVWSQDGKQRDGVFIPRRDSSSRINSLVGGRLFPGVHHHGRFAVDERPDRYQIRMDSDDGQAHVLLDARPTPELPEGSLFRSLQEASDFFERGSLGYSATADGDVFDGLELQTFEWRVQPLAVQRVESSYFEDERYFPRGSIQFDCALLMREIEHQWCERPSLCYRAATASA